MAAGNAGLANRVDNVFFMEVPDIYKYVDPYGMLITTLYPIADNEPAIRAFIPQLVAQKASCVAIKLGRFIHEVPYYMLEQADEHGIPLIILPKHANLSKFSNAILELFLGKKTSVLEYRDRIHGELMALLLEGADLAKLVATVSDLFGVPILLMDHYLHIQTTSFGEAGQAYVIRQPEAAGASPSPADEISVHWNGKDYGPAQVLWQPIVASSEYLGYLVALVEQPEARGNLTIGLEQASMLCAFLFQRERALQQNERNYLDSFIRDVLNGKFANEQEAIQKATVFDWDLSFPLVMVRIEVRGLSESGKREAYSAMLLHRMVEQYIGQHLGLPSRSYKVVYYDEALLCLISTPDNKGMRDKLRQACSGMIGYYKRNYPLGIGISNAVHHAGRLLEANEEAKLALNIAKKLHHGEAFIMFYSETGIYKLLHQIADPAVLHAYVEEKLGRLLEEMDLLDTLICLQKNSFNLQKAAKELYIHYNTLRYRIDKLKEYGIDVANGLELAEIAFAYQIYRYIQLQERKDR